MVSVVACAQYEFLKYLTINVGFKIAEIYAVFIKRNLFFAENKIGNIKYTQNNNISPDCTDPYLSSQLRVMDFKNAAYFCQYRPLFVALYVTRYKKNIVESFICSVKNP